MVEKKKRGRPRKNPLPTEERKIMVPSAFAEPYTKPKLVPLRTLEPTDTYKPRFIIPSIEKTGRLLSKTVSSANVEYESKVSKEFTTAEGEKVVIRSQKDKVAISLETMVIPIAE